MWLAWVLLVFFVAAPAHSVEVCSTPPQAGAWDLADNANINIPIVFNGAGDAASSLFSLSNVQVRLTHTYPGDLSGNLISPAGTDVRLWELGDGSTSVTAPGLASSCNKGDMDITFADSASTVLNVPNEGTFCIGSNDTDLTGGTGGTGSPFSFTKTNPGDPGLQGTAKPVDTVDTFASFIGDPVIGTWNVFVSDDYANDVGTIDEVCLDIGFAGVTLDFWVSSNATCTDQLDSGTFLDGDPVYFCYTLANRGDETFEIRASGNSNDHSTDLTGLEGNYGINGSGTDTKTVIVTHTAGSGILPLGSHTFNADSTIFGTDTNFTTTDSLNAPKSINVTIQQDTDGDGVVDVSDTCPGTTTGLAVDTNGCPTPIGIFNVSDAVPDAGFDENDLVDAGLTSVDAASLAFYETGFNDPTTVSVAPYASPGNPTLAELQAVVDTVNNADPTVVSAIPDQVSAKDVAITPFDITPFFTDPDGDTLTYSAIGLPGALSINSATGVITGTPNVFTTSGVTVTATDPIGASVSIIFSWTIGTVADAAQAKIEAYADDNSQPAPTVQDYIDAGITGVTAVNLADVNAVVDAMDATGVDTTAEIQALVDMVNTPAANVPGGVAGGLQLWLDAADVDGDGNSNNDPADGASIAAWVDKSGNANDATIHAGQSGALYSTAAADSINGSAVLQFNRIDQSNGSVYSSAIDIRPISHEDLTLFTVYRSASLLTPADGGHTSLWGSDNEGWDRFFATYHPSFGDGIDDGLASLGLTENGQVVPDAGKVGIVRLMTAVYDGAVSGGINSGPVDGSSILFDGKLVTNFTDSTHASDAQSRLFIGWDGDDGAFDGDIAEMIVYDRKLSACEIEQVNNYLGVKYGRNFVDLSSNYNHSAPYTHDINGIGTPATACPGGQVIEVADSDIAKLSNASSNDTPGELLTFAHDAGGYAPSTEVPAGSFAQRLTQAWQVDEEGDLGTVEVCFNLTGLNIGTSTASDFALLIDTDGDFSNAAEITAGRSVNGDEVCFAGVDFNHGDYFTLAIPLPTLYEILEDSASTGGADNANNTAVTAVQLAAITGMTHVLSANESAYQAVVASETGFSNPPTVAEVQAVIDAVNAHQSILNEILEDSASTGGNNNANGTAVTAVQLAAISGVINVDPSYEADYQAAIAAETGFSNPPTVAQVQAIINTVNVANTDPADFFTGPSTISGTEDTPISMGIIPGPVYTEGGPVRDIIGTATGYRLQSAGTTATSFTIPAAASSVRITALASASGGNSGTDEDILTMNIEVDLDNNTSSGILFFQMGLNSQDSNFAWTDAPLGSAILTGGGTVLGDSVNALNNPTISVSGNQLQIVETQSRVNTAYLVEFLDATSSSLVGLGNDFDYQPFTDTTTAVTIPANTAMIVVSGQSGRLVGGSGTEDPLGISRFVIDLDNNTASGAVVVSSGNSNNTALAYSFTGLDVSSSVAGGVLSSSATILGDVTANADNLSSPDIVVTGNTLNIERMANGFSNQFGTLYTFEFLKRKNAGSPAVNLGTAMDYQFSEALNDPITLSFDVPSSARFGVLNLNQMDENSNNQTNENKGFATVFIDLENNTSTGSFQFIRAQTPDLLAWNGAPLDGTTFIAHTLHAASNNPLDAQNLQTAALTLSADGSTLQFTSLAHDASITNPGSPGSVKDLGVLGQVQWFGFDPFSVTVSSGGSFGATLSSGQQVSSGEWQVDPADIANITLTAPPNFNGSAGSDFNLTVTAGSQSLNMTIEVTAVDDNPVLTTQVTSATDNSGNSIAEIHATSSSSPGAISGIAITSTTTAIGIWQYSLDGTTWVDVDSVSDTTALLLGSTDRIRLVPDATPGTATITFRAWDENDGVAGSKVDVSTAGNGLFAIGSDTASLSVALDTDGDGIADTLDNCANTTLALAVDSDGCATLAGIVSVSNDPADGGFGVNDLTDAGLANVSVALLNQYETGFADPTTLDLSAYADPLAPTLSEVQAVIDAVNLASGLDSDNDGLTDVQEAVLGTDPLDADSDSSQTAGTDESDNDISDALEDLDGDGISNIAELANGTDPLNADDPLTGGAANGTADNDNDGLSNGEEALLGTDPGDADSDSTVTTGTDEAANGISDALEDFDDDGISNIAELSNGTDPLNGDDPLIDGGTNGSADNDNDGLSNGEEALLGTDPVDADSDSSETSAIDESSNTINDGDEDLDGDGISNIDELVNGSNPLDVNDPFNGGGNSDTDGDGLTDAQEFVLGMNPADSDSDSSVTVVDEAANELSDALEDLDGDGLSNIAELANSTDPLNADDPLTGGAANGTADDDNDGLSNGEEALLGTDPGDADSDSTVTTGADEAANGISDALEDFDGDGISNIAELSNGTDPLNGDDPLIGGGINGGADNDNDGLSNGEEALLGTNPVDADSDSSQTPGTDESTNTVSDALEDLDGDGISNMAELANGTNPLNGNDPLIGGGTNGSNDDDNDGLSNGEEALLGTDPTVADSDSSQTLADELNNGIADALEDFDGDGISNIAELANGTNPLSSDDPLTDGAISGGNDTDGDGLTDGEEALLGTNPDDSNSDSSETADVDESTNSISDALEDLDGDGISNIAELANGTNPLDANDPLNDGATNGSDDDDNDGLSNGEEALLGTDPVDADSDSSQTSAINESSNIVNDGDEDLDGDGISNIHELINGSNPLDGNDPFNGGGNNDTDGDGLTDAQEFVLGMNINDINSDSSQTPGADESTNTVTDALEDLDNDGISNIVELANGTDPLDGDSPLNGGGTNGSDDDDGDGLSNGEEALLGTDPTVSDSNSSETLDDESNNGLADALEDFDGDGISNIAELANGSNPLDSNDPLNDGATSGNDDPDGDGLSNGEEALLGTSPTIADSDSTETEVNEANNSINDANEDFDGDGVSNIDELNAGSNPLDANNLDLVKLQLKTILAGAYHSPTGLMFDRLRSKDLIPLSEPYTALGFANTESGLLDAAILDANGDDAVVDWLLIELRSTIDPTQVITRHAVLLQRDGNVMDVTGNETLSLLGIAAGDYHVVIRHRNHLGVMTANPVSLSETVTSIDFSNPATQVFGTDARTTVNTDVVALWAGDANGDGRVIGNGPNTDVNSIFGDVLLDVENITRSSNYIVKGYLQADLNLDGRVIFVGVGNMVNVVAGATLLHPANDGLNNNYIIQEQLP